MKSEFYAGMKGIIKLFTIDIPGNRIYGLDVLRAIAIIYVVFLHGISILPTYLTVIQILLNIDGVSFFFGLSGFLIGGILIKILQKEQPSVPALFRFWKKRWLRTVPNYFLVLVILCVHASIVDKNFSLWNVKEYFFFLQNFNTPVPDFYAISWSLTVEEWFYLIIPSTIFILTGVGKIPVSKAILVSAISIIVLIIFTRYCRYIQYPPDSGAEWDAYFRRQVVTRLDSLIFGVIGAYISFYHQDLWLRYKKQAFICGVLLILFVKLIEIFNVFSISSIYMSVFSFTVLELGTMFLLPLLSQIKTGKGLLYRVITYISISSYSIYLFHYHIIRHWIIDNMDLTGFTGTPLVILKYAAYWMLTITLSLLIYKYFEKPIMDLRNIKGMPGVKNELTINIQK